jgi:uroporphyrinogen decarboxylase
MDRKERVWHAVHHQAPDRVPIDYSARPEVSAALRTHLGLASQDDLLAYLDADFRYIEPREVIYDRQRYQGPPLRTFPDDSWEDIWGVRRVRLIVANGAYDEVCAAPLAHATTVEEVEAHRWPTPDWFDYRDVPAQCRRYAGYALVGGGWGAIFGDAYRLQGLQTFLMNMAERPEVAQAIIDRVARFYYGVNERIFDAVAVAAADSGPGLDIFYFGNDFGTQRALLLSPRMYRQFFAAGIARLAGQAKERGMAVMYHSCGAVHALIPDFIAAGIDILDPVQAQAVDMDPLALKAQFGSRICFHGGIDTQRLLPFATPAAVQARIRQIAEAVGANGGYILAPDQSLQGDIPVENILAMYTALL